MSGKPYEKPSSKAQAYIDAYLRMKGATCHDVGRLFGVAHSTISNTLKRWNIPQRYKPGEPVDPLVNRRLKRSYRIFPATGKERERKAIRRATGAPIPMDEVARRLAKRSP